MNFSFNKLKKNKLFWNCKNNRDLHYKTLREFGATDYVYLQIITDQPGQFKQYKPALGWKEYQELNENENGYKVMFIYAKSIDELIQNAEEFEIKYIIAKEEGNFYPFINDLYSNEKNYLYLTKVFDSDEFDFKKLKLKVFEINYEKFHEWEINSVL